MVKEPTVFILGAGASCPYGFPTGKELRTEIIKHFVDDCKSWLRHRGEDQKIIDIEAAKAAHFVEAFQESHTRSIDLFIGRNPEFQFQGTLAIAFRIISAEHNSKFGEDIRDQQRDWYFRLFELLTDKLVKKDDYKSFCENKVSFITFNYDRSLEHFLYGSLCNSFHDISEVEITNQLKTIPFIHIFGQIAPLPWQNGKVSLKYGMPSHVLGNIDTLRKNLRTIYEKKTIPFLKDARRLISEAKNIYFLGFGYAEENLQLLEISNCLKVSQMIYGTALGATERGIKRIKSLFHVRQEGHSNSTIIHDFDCLHLLREYLLST